MEMTMQPSDDLGERIARSWNNREAHRNPDGTYNGVAILAELSGLSTAEVAWTAARLKQLMTIEGKPREEAVEIVCEEGLAKPWMSTVDKHA